MATTQTATRKSTRGNGHDKKAVAARAVKDDLYTAQEAASTFVSALKSSAEHLGETLTRAAEEKADLAQDKAKAAVGEVQKFRTAIEDKVREKPFMAIGVAAGAGILLALLTRR